MGAKLAETQADLTPIQRFVYLMAKDHNTPDSVKKSPAGMKEGTEMVKGFK